MRQRSRPIDRATADDPSLSSAAAGVTESWAQCFAVLHRRVLTIDNKGHTKLMIDVFFSEDLVHECNQLINRPLFFSVLVGQFLNPIWFVFFLSCTVAQGIILVLCHQAWLASICMHMLLMRPLTSNRRHKTKLTTLAHYDCWLESRSPGQLS